MSLRSKGNPKKSSLAKGRKDISTKLSKKDLKKSVVKLAKTSRTYDEIRSKIEEQTGSTISKPTIKRYLKQAWGDDFKRKRAEMSKRKTLMRKWKNDFDDDRVKIKKVFHEDYLSAGDGLYYVPEKNKLISMPPRDRLKVGAIKLISLDDEFFKRIDSKNKITFSKDRNFGYSEDRGKDGVFDASVVQIIMKQLRTKLKNDPDKEKKLNELAEQLKSPRDLRSDMLFGKDILDRKMCPGFSTTDKTARGRTRMLALQGIDTKTNEPYVFSKVVYNIPYLLHTHPKRIGITAHNISKKPVSLLKPEEPIVKADFNNLEGINLKVRMPRVWTEDKMTEESSVIITKKAADKMRYFAVVESGSLMVDNLDKLPDTYRSSTPIKTHNDIKDHYIKALEISRGDIITMAGIEDIESSIAEKQVGHSGRIVLIGDPVKRMRNITIDPDLDVMGRSTRKIEFFRQAYQIVREDELHRGDKLLLRGGIKSVVGDIVDDLGKDKQGRDYDMVVNYGDVWRKADPKDKDYELKEETFIRQGKKKASVVLEHRDADGKMYAFLIDKFASDEGSKLPMRISTTFVGGLWELAVNKVLKKDRYTNAELKDATQRFVENYVRDPGTMITSLKALHYRMVEEDGKIRIERDPEEPTSDKYGKIYQLTHEVDGKIYHTAYLPHFMSRLYRDARTTRERFKIDLEDEGSKDRQWKEMVKTIRNSMYMFPKIINSKELVAIPYVNVGDMTDVNTIRMDSLDVETAGGDPSDKDLTLSWKKEPVTNSASIQTAKVLVDFTGDFRGVVGVHVDSAKKAVLDYDGDQVVVFSPPIKNAMIKPTAKEIEDLNALKTKNYSQETFESLYNEASQTRYAENEKELGMKCAKYNQDIAVLENRLIQEFGGVKRSALLLYKSERPPIIKIGEGKTARKFEMTPNLVNRVCDVEKVLKLREPYWTLRALYKKKWKDLNESERDLVEDMHIRRALKRLIRQEQTTPNVRLLNNLLRNEHAFMSPTGERRERSIDPLGLVIDPKSNRLLDKILYQQIKISGLDIVGGKE